MSYVAKILQTNESIFYTENRSMWSILPCFLFLSAIIPVALIGIGVLMVVSTGINNHIYFSICIAIFTLFSIISYCISKVIIRNTELAITNKRIIAKYGVFRIDTIELYLHKIESISVEQSLLGRIFNYGSIIIHGYGGTSTPIVDIVSPLSFKKELETLYDKVKVNTEK